MQNVVVKRKPEEEEPKATPEGQAPGMIPVPESTPMGQGAVVWECQDAGFVDTSTGEFRNDIFVVIHNGHPIRNLRGEAGDRVCWSEDAIYSALGNGEPFRCAACPHVADRQAYIDYHRKEASGDVSVILEAHKGNCRLEYELHWKEQYRVGGGQFSQEKDAKEGIFILPRVSIYDLLDERDPASYKRRLLAAKLDLHDVVTRIFVEGSRLRFEPMTGFKGISISLEGGRESTPAPKGAPAAVSAALDPAASIKVRAADIPEGTAALMSVDEKGKPQGVVIKNIAGEKVRVHEGLPPPTLDDVAREALGKRLDALGEPIRGIVLGVLAVKSVSEIGSDDLAKLRCVVEEAEKQAAPKEKP